MRLFLTCCGIALLFLVVVTVGQETGGPADKSWTAPADAAAKQNPQAGKPDAVASGKKVFLRSCAECHGEDGTGLQEGVSNLQSTEVQQQSDGALFWKISTGNLKKGMPSFSKTAETDRWNVISFLRTLKPAAAPSGGNQPTSPKGR